MKKFTKILNEETTTAVVKPNPEIKKLPENTTLEDKFKEIEDTIPTITVTTTEAICMLANSIEHILSIGYLPAIKDKGKVQDNHKDVPVKVQHPAQKIQIQPPKEIQPPKQNTQGTQNQEQTT
jgi:hypothetical protein